MTQDNKRLFVLLVIVINLVICVAVQACDFVIFYTFSYLCNSSSFSFYHLGLEIDLEQLGRTIAREVLQVLRDNSHKTRIVWPATMAITESFAPPSGR